MTLGWKAFAVAFMAVALFVLKLTVKKRDIPRSSRRRWVMVPEAPPPKDPAEPPRIEPTDA